MVVIDSYINKKFTFEICMTRGKYKGFSTRHLKYIVESHLENLIKCDKSMKAW